MTETFQEHDVHVVGCGFRLTWSVWSTGRSGLQGIYLHKILNYFP